MNIKHDIYLISDSTGETIDRIFLALKAQFLNFKYRDNNYFSKYLEIFRNISEYFGIFRNHILNFLR